MGEAFLRYGPPVEIVSDRYPVFTSAASQALLDAGASCSVSGGWASGHPSPSPDEPA